MTEETEMQTGQGRVPGSPLDTSSVHRRRPILWLTLAFALGLVVDAYLRPGISAIGGFCAATLLLVLGMAVCRPRALKPGTAFLAAGLLAALSGGMLRHALETRKFSPQDVVARTPSTPTLVWVEGTVREVRAKAGRGRAWWMIDLHALGVAAEERTAACGRIQVSVSLKESADRVCEGDRVLLPIRLEAPASATVPSGFDAAAYLEHLGVRRVGVGDGERLQVMGSAPWWRVDLWLRRFSGALARRNERLWGVERAALPNALLLGRRDGIDSSDKESFQRVGTAHLLAISGLHLQLLAAGVWWLLGRLGWSRRSAGTAVILFAAAYVALSGGQPPIVRAALMIALYLGGQWFYRAVDPLAVVSVTALLILLWQPGSLFMAGFQLSFLAVLSLLTLYPSLEAAWRSWRRFPEEWVMDPGEMHRLKFTRGLRQAFLVSLAAWLGTAPAVAWHMGYFSLGAVAMNMLVVPLTGVAMLGGGVALLAGPGWIGQSGIVFPTLLLGFNRWVSEFSWMGWDVPRPSSWAVLSCLAVALWAWWGRGKSATLPRMAVLLPASVAVLACGGLFRETVPDCRLTIADVPRGRSAVVETPGHDAVLVDCGGDGAGRMLSEYLKKEGHRALALLIVTEDDPDALGGAMDLLQRIPVRRVILPRSATPSSQMRALTALLGRKETPYQFAESGCPMTGPGDLRWTFFSDAPGRQGLALSGSEALCVRLEFPGTRVVFAPVRSATSLRRVQAAVGDSIRCDVLRLYGARRDRLPDEVERLIRLSEARLVVAEDRKGAGEDLSGIARTCGVRLLTPSREGSLRFGSQGEVDALAYRDGAWRAPSDESRDF